MKPPIVLPNRKTYFQKSIHRNIGTNIIIVTIKINPDPMIVTNNEAPNFIYNSSQDWMAQLNIRAAVPVTELRLQRLLLSLFMNVRVNLRQLH